ncbi:sensor histidine kinase [Dehalogenimonas etheniformans]|nr:ATP-binding protein [Dehalogenimonas etheniformans]QNT75893.1 PAS domain S-box protein [Dehalogenimonas etheniformans]
MSHQSEVFPDPRNRLTADSDNVRLEDTQRAVLNILEDFDAEKEQMHDTSKALLNILEDLNVSNEELQQSRDVLEERVIERTAELTREKNISDTTIESLPGVFYLFDTQGKFLKWNKNWELVTGVTAEEMPSKTVLEFFEGEDRTLIEQRIGEVFEKGQSTAEANFVSRDGRRTPYYFTGRLVVLDGKECLIGVGMDISERKLAEEAIKSRTEELARSNAELEQFAYIASHDLQEPLRMVSSYVQLLGKRYQGKLDADADEFIHYAADGANRMQRLINDLLAYSRVGTRGGTFEPTPLESILNQALDNLKMLVSDSGVIITHDALPMVYGDAGQLSQVFQNLIDNAIKFRGDDVPRVHISAEIRGNECVCSVQDNGIGIAPEYRERIFLIFQRLHTRSKYPGTGIGLAICKRIVERHGGRIWVESAPEGGSVFHFTLPISPKKG